MSRISWKRVLPAIVVMAMVVGACAGQVDETFSEIGSGLNSGGSTGEDRSDSTSGGATEAPEAPGEAEANPLGTGGIHPAVLTPADFGRDIIFTADMTVAVPDVAAAGEEATRIIQGLGGFLFGQSTQGSPNPRSVLTFKVQPEDFHTALKALGDIGEVRNQNVSANDVTERVVDLESQIATAETSVARLRSLLLEASDIKAVIELENELLNRETQLESLRGQLRTLEDQVALATIVVALTEADSSPGIELAVTVYGVHDDGASCPGDGEMGIEEGGSATVCFEVLNVGDTLLTNFELRDPVLDIETKDLIVVYGDTEMAIEPGESLVFAAEIVVERSLRSRTTVTADPVDADGDPLAGRTAQSTQTAFITAVDPGGVPTFAEGLSASWDWLVSLGQVLVLVAGALIPFFWVPLVVYLVWRLRRKPEVAAVEESSTTA